MKTFNEKNDLLIRQLKPLRLLGIAAAVLCCFCTSDQARADELFGGLTAPGNVVYNWTNGLRTGPGVSFTIGEDYNPNDTMTITSSGSVDYLAAGGAEINGAGVGLSSINLGQASTRLDPSNRVLNNGGLALWNADFGAVRMFIPDASHGLGSSTPPLTVSTTRTLADIFSEVNGFTGLAAGQQFHILPVDSNTGNSGSYQVDVAIQSIPEPSAGLITAIVLGSFGLLRRRRNA